jgi:hypothetical protein
MNLFQTLTLASTFPGMALLEVQSQAQQPVPHANIATNPTPAISSVIVQKFKPTITGFNSSPVSGFNAHPVTGFNANPIGRFNARPVSGFNSNLVQGLTAQPVTGLNEKPVNGLTTPVRPQSSVIVAGALPQPGQTNSGSAPATNPPPF